MPYEFMLFSPEKCLPHPLPLLILHLPFMFSASKTEVAKYLSLLSLTKVIQNFLIFLNFLNTLTAMMTRDPKQKLIASHINCLISYIP